MELQSYQEKIRALSVPTSYNIYEDQMKLIDVYTLYIVQRCEEGEYRQRRDGVHGN